jgi:hypothetical protein
VARGHLQQREQVKAVIIEVHKPDTTFRVTGETKMRVNLAFSQMPIECILMELRSILWYTSYIVEYQWLKAHCNGVSYLELARIEQVHEASKFLELAAKDRAHEAREKPMIEALVVAKAELTIWLDCLDCDCPAEGHICGRPRVEQSLAQIDAAMKGVNHE